jgi:hypothetical protein
MICTSERVTDVDHAKAGDDEQCSVIACGHRMVGSTLLVSLHSEQSIFNPTYCVRDDAPSSSPSSSPPRWAVPPPCSAIVRSVTRCYSRTTTQLNRQSATCSGAVAPVIVRHANMDVAKVTLSRSDLDDAPARQRRLLRVSAPRNAEPDGERRSDMAAYEEHRKPRPSGNHTHVE